LLRKSANFQVFDPKTVQNASKILEKLFRYVLTTVQIDLKTKISNFPKFKNFDRINFHTTKIDFYRDSVIKTYQKYTDKQTGRRFRYKHCTKNSF